VLAIPRVLELRICLLIIISFVLIPFVGTSNACEPDRVDASARVDWVYDGDTVSLDSGPRVRMIGINAPELGRDGKPSQPYANKARRVLQEMLAGSDNRVGLRYGKERRDRYNRTLAHMYLPDGHSVSAEMLKHGLAVAITVPPNDGNLACYRQAEAQARERRLGIWALPQFQTLDSRRLGKAQRGYRIVEGVVKGTARSRSATWLNLQGGLGVYVDHNDAPYFKGMDFPTLKGERILARGWIHERHGGLRMRLRHPADFKVVQ
jgi:micrococcal nuclease